MIEPFRQPVMRRHSEPYRHTRMYRRRSYGMHISNRRDLIVHIFGAKYKRLSSYYTQRHKKEVHF